MNETLCFGNCTVDFVNNVTTNITQKTVESGSGFMYYLKQIPVFLSNLWSWIGDISTVTEKYAPYKILFAIILFLFVIWLLGKLFSR